VLARGGLAVIGMEADPDAADADLVIEVVPEHMVIKRQLLAELDRACRPDAGITLDGQVA